MAAPKKKTGSLDLSKLTDDEIKKLIRSKSKGNLIVGKDEIEEQCILRKIRTNIPTLDYLGGGGITEGRWTTLGGNPSACLGRDVPVLMFDGSLKMSQDIIIDDILMGDDSTPRRVIKLFTGIDKMYQIDQSYGESYIVNSQHLITVCNTEKDSDQIPFDINVEEYILKNETFKYRNRGIKTNIEYDHKYTLVDPYIVGLWLGDGHSKGSRISSSILDTKVIDYVKLFAKNNNLKISIYKDKRNENGININISGVVNRKNSFLDALKSLDLLNNKHIPEIYAINSRTNRLKLLAGLIDSNGDYSFSHKSFNFTNKNKLLVDQTINLCRSLGYKTNLFKRTINKEEYFVISINGNNLDEIPVLLDRKKAEPKSARKNWLFSALDINPIGEGEYFGFEVVGTNNRFVLGDYTITHNCKTTTSFKIIPAIQRHLESIEQGNKRILYIDPEGAFDFHYASYHGINLNRIMVLRTKVLEDVFAEAFDYIEMGLIGGMIIDSLDGLVPRKTDDNAFQNTMGALAGALSAHLPNLFYSTLNNNVTTICVRQARVKMNTMSPGEVITFSGGKAYRHFQDAIYLLKRLSNKNLNYTPIQVKAEKTRSSRMGLTLDMPLGEIGLDCVRDLCTIAIAHGIIPSSGSWFEVEGQKVQGSESVVSIVREDTELYNKLYENVYQNVIDVFNVVGKSNTVGEELITDFDKDAEV